MLTLIWYEFKKLFLKKSTLVLIILITGLGYITTSDNMSYMNDVQDTIAYTDDMRKVTSNELKAYRKSIQKEYAGYMDDAWKQKIEKDYQNEKIKSYLTNVDEAMMIQKYGNDWKAQFEKQPEVFEQIKYENEQDGRATDTGKKSFYVLDYTTTVRYSVLSDIIRNDLDLMNQPWHQNLSEDMIDAQGRHELLNYHIPDSILNSPAKTAYFKEKMDTISNFYYDDTTGWNILLNTMASTRFGLALAIIFIASRSINSDQEIMDIMKSSQFGKKKAILAKLIALLLSCVCFVAVYTSIFTLYVYLTTGLGSWQASTYFLNNYLSPYTIKDAFIGGTMLLLCGSITAGFVSALLSTYFKKGFVSFALSLLIFVAPIVLPSSIECLFPVEYMDFSSIYLYTNIMEVFHQCYFTPIFIYIITAIVFVICCGFIVPRYCSYKICE